MDGVFPIITSIFSVGASGMLGLMVNKLNSIEQTFDSKLSNVEERMADSNGKLFSHLTSPNMHETGLSKISEQINVGLAKQSEQIANLLQVVKLAHERQDRHEANAHDHER